jgi:PmbA protein
MTSKSEFDEQFYQDVVSNLLTEARSQGATAAEADASIVKGLSVTVRMGEVETVEYNQDRGLGVTVYQGQRKGSASTSDFSPGAVKEAVTAALNIARYTSGDDYAGLADAALMAHDYPDLDLYHPWHITAEDAIEQATECEAAARRVDERISNSEGASVSTHTGFRVYGNTHGFVGSYPSSRHSVSCSVIAREGDSMQRDYWYSAVRNAANLEAATQVGEKAAQRTLRRLNGRRLGTTRVPVLFAAEVASSLLTHFISAIQGASLYRRSSFLLDSLGEEVFPEFVTVREQPHIPCSIGGAPFDSEGVGTREREIVSRGVVEGYVLDSYAARKLNMQTTGNAGGVHNLSINHGELDLDGLLRKMGTGLLVTELMGQGVNRVTGDYSRGAAGFWVENGEIRYPVEEITVAGNLRDMFRQIVAVGRDVDTRRNVRTGSILLESMTVAGS